jgi:hypothetical protein
MEGYILKHNNPAANPKNALQFTNLSGLCCGDKKNAVACRYRAVLGSVGSTTAISSVKIGGTVYTLDGAYLVNQARERDLLVANITKIVQETLGYTAEGNITWTFASSTLTIETDYSDLVFDYLGADTTPFVPTACKFIGEADTTTCAAGVAITHSASSGTLTLDFYSSGTITNISLTNGTSSAFNSDPAAGSADNAVVTRAADGAWHLVVTAGAGGALWENTETLTFTVIIAGCASPFVWTGKLVFPNIA